MSGLNGSLAPVDAVDIPDVAGESATVEALLARLRALSVVRHQLAVSQVAGALAEDDPVEGYPPTDPDGNVNSYRNVRAHIEAQEQRLAEAFPAEMEKVREIVRVRDEGTTE